MAQINKLLLKKKAEILKRELANYASNPDVKDLQFELLPFIERAINLQINEPTDTPGGYRFVEGSLPRFRTLESAYADFKVEITGMSDSEVLKWMNEQWPDKA